MVCVHYYISKSCHQADIFLLIESTFFNFFLKKNYIIIFMRLFFFKFYLYMYLLVHVHLGTHIQVFVI